METNGLTTLENVKRLVKVLQALGYKPEDSLESLTLDCQLSDLESFICTYDTPEDAKAVDCFVNTIFSELDKSLGKIVAKTYDKVFGM